MLGETEKPILPHPRSAQYGRRAKSKSISFTPQRGKFTQINQVIAKLDDGANVHFLDIGHRFLNSDGTLPAEIMPDYLYLSPKSYDIWADAIELKLAELLGGKM